MNTQERALLRQMVDELDPMFATRERATDIATAAAAANPPTYHAPDFVPHEWVVDAVQAGYKAGLIAAREAIAEYVDHFETRAKNRKAKR